MLLAACRENNEREALPGYLSCRRREESVRGLVGHRFCQRIESLFALKTKLERAGTCSRPYVRTGIVVVVFNWLVLVIGVCAFVWQHSPKSMPLHSSSSSLSLSSSSRDISSAKLRWWNSFEKRLILFLVMGECGRLLSIY